MDWEERKFGRHIYGYYKEPLDEVSGKIISAAYFECDCGELVTVTRQSKSGHSTCSVCAKQYVLEGGKFLRVDICPDCQAPLKFINGKYGKFYGCTNYPSCRFTRRLS